MTHKEEMDFLNIVSIAAARARWQAEVKYGFPGCNTTSTAYQYLLEKGLIDV